MKSFYGQLQASMSDDWQTQAEEKEKFQAIRTKQERDKCFN